MFGSCSEMRSLRAYVEDTGAAAHTASELIDYLDHVFEQIQKESLKRSLENCQMPIVRQTF